jgi:excisionase family DNA binding protein
MKSVDQIVPGWFSIPGAARYTGFSEPTIRKAIDLGKLPKGKVDLEGTGKKPSVRIKREHLDAWIEGREIQHSPTESAA